MTKHANKFFRLYIPENDLEEKTQNTIHNQFYNILRHFDVLPNFSFATGETMGDYY